MGDIADDMYDEAILQEAGPSITVDVSHLLIKQMDKEYNYGVLEWNSMRGPILVKDMTTDHISNTIPFIQKGGVSMTEPIKDKWIEIFELELKRRESNGRD